MPSIKEPTRFVSRKQIAEMLGVNYFSIYKWEKAGRLTPHKLTPGTIRYPIEELEALIEAAKGK
jgi:predicted site-specific integrase-resolvase